LYHPSPSLSDIVGAGFQEPLFFPDWGDRYNPTIPNQDYRDPWAPDVSQSTVDSLIKLSGAIGGGFQQAPPLEQAPGFQQSPGFGGIIGPYSRTPDSLSGLIGGVFQQTPGFGGVIGGGTQAYPQEILDILKQIGLA
jgi:hypothetical protein